VRMLVDGGAARFRLRFASLFLRWDGKSCIGFDLLDVSWVRGQFRLKSSKTFDGLETKFRVINGALQYLPVFEVAGKGCSGHDGVNIE